MKKTILISIICMLLMNFGMAQEKGINSLFNNIKPLFTLQEKFDLDNLKQMSSYNTMVMKEVTFSNTTQIVFSLLILILAFFVIVITPLILIYCWLNNLFDYKKYPDKSSMFSSEFYDLPKHVFLRYRQTYSNLFGNGFGIIAWVLSSYFYVTKNIDGVSAGLAEYFSFPFKLLSSITTNGITVKDAIPTSVWISMLLIVGLSILLFFLGRHIGTSIINANHNKSQLLEAGTQIIITNP